MSDIRIIQYVNQALKYGAIKKEPCVVCGTDQNIHAHHTDYNQPLKITWICSQCHGKLHAFLRKEQKGPIRAESTNHGRTKHIIVLVTVVELELIRQAAKKSGMSMSAFTREKVLYQKGGIFNGSRKPKE